VTRIVICGIRGRMGRSIVQLASERTDVEIIAGIGSSAEPDAAPPVTTLEDAAAGARSADVLVDFSAPAATAALLDAMGDDLRGRGLIVGTTGLDADTLRRLQQLAERAAVLVAANFSIGINLLLGLTERAAAALGADQYDIEIIEAHHRRKADAPSGTALALGAAAAAGRGVELDRVRVDGRSGATGTRPEQEIGLHAVRGGGIAGEHRVLFAGAREIIELRHEALDRAVFAEGALRAACWLTGRPAGLYSMRDVLGLRDQSSEG
jgi:4-hydroxy-tetrahydrodipicolinate reductase